jgi:cell division topological specificity factor
MGFLDTLFGREKPSSRAIAKERLQLVLVHDRVQLSPQMLQDLKDDVIETISRYVDIDRDAVEITISQTQRESRLVAEIPLTRVRRGRGG